MQNINTKIMFKCRKCRSVLFSEEEACSTHGGSFFAVENEQQQCSPSSNVYFLREDVMLPWMRDQVFNGNWQKGKLFCPACSCRIGSFDFVSGSKCNCGSFVLPSLHVVSNKLDRDLKCALPTEDPVINSGIQYVDSEMAQM